MRSSCCDTERDTIAAYRIATILDALIHEDHT